MKRQGSIDGAVLFAKLLARVHRRRVLDLAARYFEMAAGFGIALATCSAASVHIRAMRGLRDNVKAAFRLGTTTH